MSKSKDGLENYQLFYEMVGSKSDIDQGKSGTSDATQDNRLGLSEDQLAKLSDDLRSPMKDRAGDSNPLQ